MDKPSLIEIVIAVLLFAGAAIAQDTRYDSKYIFTPKTLGNGKIRVDITDKKQATLIYSITLDNLYTSHYHPYEFHGGHLYAIHRTEGSQGYKTHPDSWTDELWSYGQDKKGVRIFSHQGIDFRVCENEKYIAITIGDTLVIVNSLGLKIGQFDSHEFGFQDIGDLWLTNQTLFFTQGGPDGGFGDIIKMSFDGFSWTKQEHPDLLFDRDYAFNPYNECVVGSDYPQFYDADAGRAWIEDSATVTLYLYDFRFKKKSIIVTSRAKEFEPVWIDQYSFEFNDPTSSKRIIQTIKP